MLDTGNVFCIQQMPGESEMDLLVRAGQLRDTTPGARLVFLRDDRLLGNNPRVIDIEYILLVVNKEEM